MKQGLTKIVFILDQSGSMEGLKDETISGYNNFIKNQAEQEGEAIVSLVLFSNSSTLLYDNVNIKDVVELNYGTYVPYGFTAYLDALGNTIDLVGEQLAELNEDDRPEHVIFVILTDGAENSSYKYDRTKIKSMIEHQKNKYNWEFIFLGVGVEAFDMSHEIGIGNYSKVSNSPISINSMYCNLSSSVSSYRSTGLSAQMPENIE